MYLMLGVLSVIPALEGWRRKGQKITVILGCIVSSRTCALALSVAVVKHWLKQQCRQGKGFFGLSIQATTPQRGKPGQERRGCNHLGPLLILCITGLVMLSKLSHLEMVLPAGGSALPYQFIIRTVPRRHGHRPVWWRPFFSWGSVCQMNVGCLESRSPSRTPSLKNKTKNHMLSGKRYVTS